MTDPASVALVHLGCARNLIDSELMLARFAEQGLLVTGDPDGADAVVLNTCSFIGPARDESEAALAELLEKKRSGAVGAVVVAGCMVARYAHELEQRHPEVDLFAEISDYRELASSLAGLLRGEATERYIAADRPGSEREGARLLATPGSYAYLRVSHGCDHDCSFCAIPSIRGPHRSKTLEAVRAEAGELVAAGVRELVLVAEDSTAWGRDIGRSLPELVEAIADLEGDHRVRLMYAYPNAFPMGVLDLMRDHPRVLPYLDMPLQHIATPMLRAMRRSGSGDAVRRLVQRVRESVPGVTLRTTFLVGFPGETEADVAELVDFVRAERLGRMGVFTWSPEQGTSGYDLPGRVPASEAEARRKAVLEARDEVLSEDQAAWIGRDVEVLVDEVHPEVLVGRTPMDAPEVDPLAIVMRERGRAPGVGERLTLRVTGVDEEYNLFGDPAEVPA